ncbi:TetR/AcrR family transcriptional regulator [Nocardia arthritidis]|uniref:TetR/AcrR family transcriptional regulator n=1 Tax=Nocardia arthritidis TaxID=228602 RepID=UPI00142D571B|nr:TetR family transcriptional regulator [Nocardia arthritidis]
MVSEGGRLRRRRDPSQRRSEIIAAAEQIIATKGVGALTHRAVAQQAGLSPGSATYYFETIDDLLEAALTSIVDQFTAWLAEWADRYRDADRDQLVAGLTDSVMESFGEGRENSIVEYELTVAAMRNPALRPIADRCAQVGEATLAEVTDPHTAKALTAAMTGLILIGLAAPQPPTRAEIESVMNDLVPDTRSGTP